MYNIASEIKKHRLYEDYQKVKARLSRHHFVCWIAGGAVRDFCLDREVNEFDLATDATTEVLKSLFPEAVLVGESFGVLKIPASQNEFFDLATFRQESDYTDGRRPSRVESATPVKDSERRDFTINALFWDDVQNVIIDYTGGMSDLLARRLCCVGDPSVRFSEDYLRILRLARFAAVLNFRIEEKTEQAAVSNRQMINKISGERIWSEFQKIAKAGAWTRALRLDLFRTLIEIIFQTEVSCSLDEKDETKELLLLIYSLNPKIDFTDILKRKLKVSNKELAEYNSVRFLLACIENMSIEEVAFEIEQHSQYEEYLKLLTTKGLVAAEITKSLLNILDTHKVRYIGTKDLVDLIPNNEISSEFKILRIGQFKELYKTKEEMVEYLKKKYADKSKNT